MQTGEGLLGATTRIHGWVGGLPGLRIADTFPLLPSCTCAERAGKSMSSLFVMYKKIFYPRVLVVSSVCCCVFAHLQSIQYCLACPSVCVLLFVCLCLRFFCFFCLCFVFCIQTPSACFLFIPSCVKSWQQRRCGHWQCAEWKTELCRSPSILLLSYYYSFCSPQSLSLAPPPAWGLPRGGAGPVRASRCPCISCGE